MRRLVLSSSSRAEVVLARYLLPPTVPLFHPSFTAYWQLQVFTSTHPTTEMIQNEKNLLLNFNGNKMNILLL